jgi:peptidoglycan L-alanyl-D-glutamate endopeptidase CwlK
VTYALSQSSLDNLVKVHPLLVRTVKRAITITRQDFTVFEGVRTITTQREYVKRGVSQTLPALALRIIPSTRSTCIRGRPHYHHATRVR